MIRSHLGSRSAAFAPARSQQPRDCGRAWVERQPGGHISARVIVLLVQCARALYLWNTAVTDRQTILFAFSGIDLDVERRVLPVELELRGPRGGRHRRGRRRGVAGAHIGYVRPLLVRRPATFAGWWSWQFRNCTAKDLEGLRPDRCPAPGKERQGCSRACRCAAGPPSRKDPCRNHRTPLGPGSARAAPHP